MSAIAERVRNMAERGKLTNLELATIVGASPRTVARWAAGEVEPSRSARTRLLQVNYVVEQLVDVLGLTPSDANLWLFEPNRLLGGSTPAERLAEGAFREVSALIEALADGVVT